MDKKNKTLGEKIKEARNAKGMSQRTLAKLVGISHTAVGDLEKDKVRNVDIKMLGRIIEVLDMSPIETMRLANFMDYVFYFNENYHYPTLDAQEEERLKKNTKKRIPTDKEIIELDDYKRELAKEGLSDTMKILNILQKRNLDEASIINAIKMLYNIKSRFKVISKKGILTEEDMIRISDIENIDEEEAEI